MVTLRNGAALSLLCSVYNGTMIKGVTHLPLGSGRQNRCILVEVVSPQGMMNYHCNVRCTMVQL